MEAIVLILIIVLFALGSGKKKPRNTPAGTRPTAAVARPQPARRNGPAAPRVRAAQPTVTTPEQRAEREYNESLASLKQLLGMDAAPAAEGESLLEDEECRGGSMAHAHDEGRDLLDDEECRGGSMAHEHEEGVARAAHKRRMAAVDGDAGDEPAQRGPLAPGVVDAQALRRAVVMAEVLGKPRALQVRRRA